MGSARIQRASKWIWKFELSPWAPVPVCRSIASTSSTFGDTGQENGVLGVRGSTSPWAPVPVCRSIASTSSTFGDTGQENGVLGVRGSTYCSSSLRTADSDHHKCQALITYSSSGSTSFSSPHNSIPNLKLPNSMFSLNLQISFNPKLLSKSVLIPVNMGPRGRIVSSQTRILKILDNHRRYFTTN